MDIENNSAETTIEQPSGDTSSFTSDAVNQLFPEYSQDDPEAEGQGQPKAEPKSEAKAEPERKETPAEDQAHEAPSNWPQEMKDAFNALDAKGKEALLVQSKNLESGYTRKFQELSKERDKLAAFQGLVDKFQQDKDFARHILSFDERQKEATRQVNNDFGLGPRPTDPYEALKYDQVLAVRKGIAEEMAKREEVSRQYEYKTMMEQTINVVKRDEYGDRVMQEIYKFIEEQPSEKLRENMRSTLDSDVMAFRETYERFRARLINNVQQGKTTEPSKAIRSEKTPEAPLLEKGGAADETAESSEVQTKSKSKADVRAELRRGNPQPYLSEIAKNLGFI